MKTAFFILFTSAILSCAFAVPLEKSLCHTAVTLTNSHGQIELNEIQWTNKPANFEELRFSSRSRFDPCINDPALSHGIWVKGDANFEINTTGTQFIELFVMADDSGRHAFTLLENDIPVDTLFAEQFDKVRLRPKGIRMLTLMAKINGKSRIAVHSTAPRWGFSAVRLTPEPVFEKQWVPEMLDRVRNMADPFFEGRRQGRARNMQQLWLRLLYSNNVEIQNEALLGAANVYYWEAAQNHEPIDIKITNELLHRLSQTMPGNPLARQLITSSYMGLNVGGPQYDMPGSEFKENYTPLPWSVDVPENPENAPGWAVAQRVLMRRLDKITGWWVNERQIENGELGGGWGDDVEILRHWSVQATGFGSPIAARGVKRVADGVWAGDELLNGYNARVTDVEHSSEPTTDTQPMLAALYPDNAVVLDRLATTTACLKNWLTEQPDGHWRFKSAWYNCDEIDKSPERSVDVHLNVRAAGPTLWYAYLSRDPEVIDLLSRWGESWLDAMRKTDHDKPAGIIPSVVQSENGNYLVGSTEWDKPDAEWDYFQWSGGSQERLTSLLLGLYTLSGDNKWLDAVQESFSVFKNERKYPRLCSEIKKKPESFYVWRRISGNAEFDHAFDVPAKPERFEVLQLMEKEARRMEGWIGINFDMYTKEVMNTDRVYYRFPPEFTQHIFGGNSPGGEKVPNFSVTWPQFDGEIARAVLEWSSEKIEIELYSFEENRIELPVRFWQLEKGKYRWNINDENGINIESGQIDIADLPETVSFPIPAQKSVTLVVGR